MKKLEFIKRFKYFKNRNELASWIYLKIFNYKNLINFEDFGSLLFTETPFSFLIFRYL